MLPPGTVVSAVQARGDALVDDVPDDGGRHDLQGDGARRFPSAAIAAPPRRPGDRAHPRHLAEGRPASSSPARPARRRLGREAQRGRHERHGVHRTTATRTTARSSSSKRSIRCSFERHALRQDSGGAGRTAAAWAPSRWCRRARRSPSTCRSSACTARRGASTAARRRRATSVALRIDGKEVTDLPERQGAHQRLNAGRRLITARRRRRRLRPSARARPAARRRRRAAGLRQRGSALNVYRVVLRADGTLDAEATGSLRAR